ncbi:glycosyltransferase [Sphingobacterium sp. 40-24]|uniref:glycosyltransferase family 2 protein n=1 Tax=Sphingobacterium sp. 40-24 TaxID=1895843 RepID=UPI000963401A|nr:glycosyltransferase [Sphingobacterium sp. 40-24]OJZ13240.1 MAG: hypothetical protein BGP15_16165 [Sphingobacterium sp. 40-24]
MIVENSISSVLVSVIVPVYNVELYLVDCLESICKQSYRNLEIIVVNDGSIDNSLHICYEFARKDSRIQVIDKPNGGLSDARNSGLTVCKGEYICFIDSDDVIHKDFVSILFNSIADGDICMCYFTRFYNDVIPDDQSIAEVSAEEFSGDFVNQNLYDEKFDVNAITVWNKLYRKSIWKDLRFPVNRLHEDEFVVHQVLDLSKSFRLVDESLYYYRVREGSITKVKNQKNILDSIEALRNRRDYYRNRGWNQQVIKTRSLERSLMLSPSVDSKTFPQWKSYGVIDILRDEISLKMKLLMLLKKMSARLYMRFAKRKGWE